MWKRRPHPLKRIDIFLLNRSSSLKHKLPVHNHFALVLHVTAVVGYVHNWDSLVLIEQVCCFFCECPL